MWTFLPIIPGIVQKKLVTALDSPALDSYSFQSHFLQSAGEPLRLCHTYRSFFLPVVLALGAKTEKLIKPLNASRHALDVHSLSRCGSIRKPLIHSEIFFPHEIDLLSFFKSSLTLPGVEPLFPQTSRFTLRAPLNSITPSFFLVPGNILLLPPFLFPLPVSILPFFRIR